MSKKLPIHSNDGNGHVSYENCCKIGSSVDSSEAVLLT